MKLFLLVAALLGVAAGLDPDVCPTKSLPLAVMQIQNKLNAKQQELKEAGTLDPLVLDNINLQIDNPTTRLDANITGNAKGLLDFQIKVNKGTIIGGLIAELDVDFEPISINIDSYKLDGALNLLPIYGEGEISAKITNLKIHGCFHLGSKSPGKLYLKNLDFGLRVDDLQFKITGWANDENRSNALSQIISENAKDLFDVYGDAIGNKLSALIVELVKDVIIDF